MQSKVISKKISTPIGDLIAVADDANLLVLEFADGEDIKKDLKGDNGSNEITKKLESELREYFDGKRKDFDIPLNPNGSKFQKDVWNALSGIPFGRTVSYKDQAINVGNVKAVRAVANANGANKIVIVIPCHRVIGSDGSLTGYGGGLWRKKWLLKHENISV